MAMSHSGISGTNVSMLPARNGPDSIPCASLEIELLPELETPFSRTTRPTTIDRVFGNTSDWSRPGHPDAAATHRIAPVRCGTRDPPIALDGPPEHRCGRGVDVPETHYANAGGLRIAFQEFGAGESSADRNVMKPMGKGVETVRPSIGT